MKKEVREGYKMTELGEIPTEWEIKRLDDIRDKNDKYSFVGGPFGSDLKSEHYTDKGIRVIQLQNICEGYFNNDYKIYTSIEKADQLIKCNIYPDELIIAKMAEPVARACKIPNNEKRYLMCSDGIRLVVDKQFNNTDYIMYSINSEYFRKNAILNSTGSTRMRIGLNELKSLPIILPKLEEQKKIASILSTVDEQIDNVDALIEKNKELKKGLMQTLLTKGIGHTKFKKTEIGEIPEEWEVKKLEDVCEILDSKRIPLNEKQRLTMKGDIPYYGANSIVDYINNYLFDSTLILLAEDGGNFFEFKEKPIAFYVEGKCWVNNHAHVLEAKIAESSKWIFYNLVHRDLSNIVQGGTRAKLNQKDLRNIIVTFPKLEEQQKIASILSEVDNKIDEYEDKKEKLEELKKGLMQQLLTGKIRTI